MNPIRRMLHFITSPSPRVDPEQARLRREVFTQRSRHQAAITDTNRTAARNARLIESYRRTDTILFGGDRSPRL